MNFKSKILATSTPVERIFSGGADLLSKKRCSMSDETIRSCMCLKDWLKRGRQQSQI
jgi:hypothetical protein